MRWMWIVPEGTNILPDGSWHRINDLSNGANQGPAMHAIEACAGVDNTDPEHLKIMPRLPDPIRGIQVENHFVMVPGADGLRKARVSYRYEKGTGFSLRCDPALPLLSVRLGPFHGEQEAGRLKNKLSEQGLKCHASTSGTFLGQAARWLWVEDLEEVTTLNIQLK